MSETLESTLRGAAARAWRRIARNTSRPALREGQQDSTFYDRTFDGDDYWRRHYTGVEHYCCWTFLIDRLRRRGTRRLIEIGCGTGQLAAAMRDAGILDDYCGFDFSERRIGQARIACPGWRFEVADAFGTNLFATFDYDCALSTEFLEHVEGDLDALRRLPAGTYFIGTVPNYPFVSHVRHFQDASQVAERYGQVLEQIDVVPLPLNERGKTLFVLEGLRKAS